MILIWKETVSKLLKIINWNYCNLNTHEYYK